jgi:hypothetical protein
MDTASSTGVEDVADCVQFRWFAVNYESEDQGRIDTF